MHDRDQTVKRLSDRISLRRQQRFVGRAAETELFRTALLADEPPFAVLHFYGPGGVGKTTLLHELARLAAEHGRPVIHLDGRHLDPAPPTLKAAVEPVLQSARAVLLLDTYELLAPLDSWIRSELLPTLPSDTLIVIAGRHAPTAWLGDSDWSELCRIVALGNLHADESRAFLAARGVPVEQHAAALVFTHGHPLALSLTADLYRQSATAVPAGRVEERDVLGILLDRFLQDVPSPRHRQALELCVVARTTTEALLASYFDPDSAFTLFQWLRQLSFIEHGPTGVYPHDLVRDVLEADLHWRNPTRYTDVQQAAIRYARQQVPMSSAVEQQRLRMDIIFASRRAPGMRAFFAWDVMDTAYADRATTSDFPAILEMVRHFEGEQSCDIARYWQERQPESFLVYRTPSGELYGFMLQLALHRATADDAAIDPAVRAALVFVEAQRPLEPGAALSHLRFWMGRASYQAVSPAINVTAANCVIHWTTTPRLAWSFVAMSDPEFMAPHFESIQFRRTPAADFVVGERRYGVFAHDWVAEPVAQWQVDTRHAGNVVPLPDVQPLSEREVTAAVRQALRDFTRSDQLAANPLLGSSLLAGTDRTPAALQDLLRRGIETLKHNPKDARLYRALWYTYIEPEATQERVAERLDLPFNTYRYHLANGLERLAAWLWHQLQSP